MGVQLSIDVAASGRNKKISEKVASRTIMRERGNAMADRWCDILRLTRYAKIGFAT